MVGKVEVVSDIRAAQDRKSPVVNARNARCQNFLSKFMRERAEAGDEPTIVKRGSRRGRESHGDDDRCPVGET